MTTRSLLLLACLLVASPDVRADRQGGGILPDDRVADWRPGVSVGVPGGIPTNRKTLLDVTKPPFNADPTGAADAQPAIAQAIAENEVVYLPAGTYRLNRGIGVGTRKGITIRGAGPDRTILKMAPGCNAAIDIGGGGGDWWYPDRLKLPILGSAKRKTTVLAVGDTKALDALPNGGVGALCQVSLKNDPKLPVIVPGNFEYMRRQISRIVARSAGSVTISPGLLTEHPEGLAPRLAPTARQAEFVGVEDLTVDGDNCSAQLGINVSAAFACWLRNVHVLNITNYHVSISDSLQCEIRHSMIAKRKGQGSNGAGFLVGTVSSCLFEDNILVEQFPHIEVNGSSGNVFAYNFCHDSTIMGVVGCSINTNHGAHSNFNLYEGNVSPKFQSDGYHGGSSHDTAFRNWFHGNSDKTDQFWICVNLNRFTRCYSIVGNVLGSPGQRWIYDNADNGYGYDQHLIYSFGMPNMGNGGFSGTAQLSKGRPWKDWGKAPGPGGFQELDLDVRATSLVKGNYNYKDRGVAAGEALSGALPKSLYRSEKPAWFGELTWPAFGPDTAFERNKIPAQLRFEAMKK